MALMADDKLPLGISYRPVTYTLRNGDQQCKETLNQLLDMVDRGQIADWRTLPPAMDLIISAIYL